MPEKTKKTVVKKAVRKTEKVEKPEDKTEEVGAVVGDRKKILNRLIKKEDVEAPKKTPLEVVKEKKAPKITEAYATGKRKESVARVWVNKGSGKFVINKRSKEDYFHSRTQAFYVEQPFIVAGIQKKYDVKCTAKGGGVSGQAEAVRLGISRALCILDPDLRGALKKEQLLKRNDKVVERKKYGRHKARKKPQFSKR